jgi:hypothetical protein
MNIAKIKKLENLLQNKNQELYDEIKADNRILNEMKIDRNYIKIAFDNILLKLYKSNDYNAYTILEMSEIYEIFNINININIIEKQVSNKIYVNNKTLIVLCQTISNVITSPFDNNNNLFDKIYYIYDTESNDKIIISDMALYHIIKYGFFGSNICDDIIDPLLFIKLIGIYNDNDNECDGFYKKIIPSIPINTYKQYRWRSLGKMNKTIKNIDKSFSNDFADFYLYKKGTRLCIKLKKLLKNELINTSIKIFSIPFFITQEYYENTHRIFMSKIVYEDFINDNNNEGDTSEYNNYIELYENEILVQRGKILKNDLFENDFI